MRQLKTSLRNGACAVLAGLTVLEGAAGLATAQPASCTRPEFESVVDSAAATLREINQKNRLAFQDRLRLLKEKRGWSQDQFMAEASTYVQDDRIAEFDQTSGELLAKLNSMGETGSSAAAPDCRLLQELRATMKALVDTQTRKWAYMFQKLDVALKQ